MLDDGISNELMTIHECGKFCRGHCCLGGVLVVTYATRTVTVPVVNSVTQDKNNAHQSCGTWGWRRCSTTTSTSNKLVTTINWPALERCLSVVARAEMGMKRQALIKIWCPIKFEYGLDWVQVCVKNVI